MTTINWRTGTSGDCSQGSNWAGGVAPGAGDDAVIDVGGTYTGTISTAISANSLTLTASRATVRESATGSRTLAGALTLDAGTFQLNAGTTWVGAFTQSGGELAGTGTLTVSSATVLIGGLMEGGSASVRQGNLVAQGPLTITAYSSNRVGTALDGRLAGAPVRHDPNFGMFVPQSCPDVPSEVLDPRNTWSDKKAYDETGRELTRRFAVNFSDFEPVVGNEVKEAAIRPAA
jgi:hypothetical protein